MANTIRQNPTSVSFSGVATVSSTFVGACANPSLIVAEITGSTPPYYSATFNDGVNAGNYSSDLNGSGLPQGTGTGWVSIGSKQNTSATALTVTATISASTEGWLKVYEIAGAARSNALDSSAFSGECTNGSSTCATSITTLTDNCTIIAAGVVHAGGNEAADPGFTLTHGAAASEPGYGGYSFGEYKANVGSKGTRTLKAGQTSSTLSGYALGIVAYKTLSGIDPAYIADSTSLKTIDLRWAGDSASIVSSGGAFQTLTAFGDHPAWFANGQGANQEVGATIYGASSASGQIKALLLQATSGQSGYRVAISGANNLNITRNGTYAAGGSSQYTGGKDFNTDSVQLRVTKVGGVIRCYIDGVEYLNYTDGSPLTGGYPGLHLYGAGTPSTARIGNWTDGTTKFAFSNNGGQASSAVISVSKDLGTVAAGQLVVVWGGKWESTVQTDFVAADCTKLSGTATLGVFTLDCADGVDAGGGTSHYSAMWSAIVTAQGTLVVQIAADASTAYPNIGAAAFNGNWGTLRVEAFNGQSTPTDNLITATTRNMTSEGPALFCASLLVNNNALQTIAEDAAFTLLYEQESALLQASSFIYRIVSGATSDAGDWSLPAANTGGTSASGAVYREETSFLKFGDPTRDTSSFPCSSDRLLLTKFTLTDNAVISAINVLFEKPSTAGCNGKAVIFSDVAGTPTTRLAVSSSKAIPAGASDTAFPLALTLPPADYWMGCVTDSFEPRYQGLAGGAAITQRYEGYSFSTTPSTLGAVGDANVGSDLNIYAQYQLFVATDTYGYRNNLPIASISHVWGIPKASLVT